MRLWLSKIAANRPEATKLAGQSAILVIDRVVRMAVGLVVGAIVARHLGVAAYGQIAFVTATVAFAQSLATLGLDGLVVKRFIDSPESRGDVFGTALVMRLLSGLVAWAVLLLSLYFSGVDVSVLTLVAVYGAVLMVPALDVGDLWFQAIQKSPRVVIGRNAVFLFFAGIRLVLVWLDGGVPSFIAVMALELLSAAVVAWLFLRSSGGVGQLRTASSKTARSLLTSSWPLVFSGLLVTTYMKLDQILIAQMLDHVQLGIYSAALRLSEVWQFLSVTLVGVAAPAVAKARLDSFALYEQRLVKLFRAVFWFGVCIAALVSALAGPMIRLAFGVDFARAGDVLAVHIWHIPVMFLGSAVGLWMINEGLTKLYLVRALIGAAVSVVINLLLLPRIGIMGSALAAIASQLVANFLWHPFHPRTRRLFQMQCAACFGFPLRGLKA